MPQYLAQINSNIQLKLCAWVSCWFLIYLSWLQYIFSQHLLVSLRVWDDGSPGVHCHLVPAFQDSARGWHWKGTHYSIYLNIAKAMPWFAGEINTSMLIWFKVYTLMGCLEAATILVATPVVSTIYKYSLVTFPGAVYLFEAGCMMGVAVIFLVIDNLLMMQTRQW